MRKKASSIVQTTVCGGGPAALGLLLQAHKQDLLNYLMQAGLRLIERKGTFGSGELSEYKIPSNSFGTAFLELSDQLVAEQKLVGLHQSKSIAELNLYRHTDFMLPKGAAALDDIGAELGKAMLEIDPRSIQNNTTVEEIRQVEGGLWSVLTKSNSKNDSVHYSKNIVLAMGGAQNMHSVKSRSILPNISLEAYSKKITLSGDLIKMSDERIKDIFSHANDNKPIAIIGGSHSAFSVARRLDELLPAKTGSNQQIFILHRSPIKFYFQDSRTAENSGYLFDFDKDVCPLSGRVNRFGGLRYKSSEFGYPLWTARNGSRLARTVLINIHDEDTHSILDLLARASHVVSAFGYEPILPKICDASGEAIEIARDSDGGLANSPDGKLRTNTGEVVPGLFAFGLGSGLRPMNSIGGEPSFKGRVDGVWMYQNDIGRLLLKSITTNFDI